MKRFILCTVLFIYYGTSFAQQQIKEGTIIYEVEYQLPPEMKQYAAFFPKEAVVYFKGDSASSNQKTAQSNRALITNMNASYMRLLVEFGIKKFYVNLTPAEQEEAAMSMPEYSYTAGNKTDTIAKYKAFNYELKDKKTGAVVEAWFTKELAAPQNPMTMALDNAIGFPLKFTTTQGGFGVKAVVKEVRPGPVPAGSFSTPAGYEAITMQQLKAMTGGR